MKAVYLPHNGFEFNYDRWYFDSLAYDQVHDVSKNYEWLCHSRSQNSDTFTLTGLETTQQDFSWYVENELYDDASWEPVADIAAFLVKVRFVQLIQLALASGPLVLPIPVLTTTYGMDFYCRFDP